MHPRARLAAIPLLAFCCLGVMCGQKGPLYLPERPPSAEAAPGAQGTNKSPAPEARDEAPEAEARETEPENDDTSAADDASSGNDDAL